MQIFTWRQRLVVISTSLTVIIVFIGSGILLDWYFDTKPIFLIVGTVLAFPTMQFAVLKSMRKHLEKHPWKNDSKPESLSEDKK